MNDDRKRVNDGLLRGGSPPLKKLSTEGCVAQRFMVTKAGPGALSVSMNEDGLVCAGIGTYEGLPPLLVVADTKTGEGVSGLSCIRELLPFLRKQWEGIFNVVSCTVVTCGRSDEWHLVAVAWSQQELVLKTEVLPVRWVGQAERSEEAFVGAFGDQAKRALYILWKMRSRTLPNLRT